MADTTTSILIASNPRMNLRKVIELLHDCGYYGVCKNKQYLRYNLIYGAISEAYQELLTWIEKELYPYKDTEVAHKFSTLRKSYKKSNQFGKTGVDPAIIRCKLIEELLEKLLELQINRRCEAQECQHKQDCAFFATEKV